MRTTASALAGFADQKPVILTAYGRDEVPVDTPVHIGARRAAAGFGSLK